MPSIRVRFILNQGFTSAAIAKMTGSLFSHVEFGTPEGTWIGAHLQGGVQERPADYCKPIREYVYDVPCTADEMQRAYAMIRGMIGTAYNVKDIIGLALQARSLRSPHRLICSQFFARVMLTIFGAMRFLNVEASWDYRITPETGHLSPMLAGHLTKRVG